MPLRTAHSLTCTVLLGLGRADLSFRTVLVWAVVLTPLFVFGARYGLTGVTLAWVLGFPLVYLASVWMIVRAMNIPASLMFEPMLAPALSAGACAGVVFALQGVLHGYLPQLPLLGLEIICGALIYVLALRLLSRQIFAEVLDLVLRFAGKRAPTTG